MKIIDSIVYTSPEKLGYSVEIVLEPKDYSKLVKTARDQKKPISKFTKTILLEQLNRY